MSQLFEIELEWGFKPTAEQCVVIEKLRGEKVKFEQDGVTLDWAHRNITGTMEEVASLAPYQVKKALPYQRLAGSPVVWLLPMLAGVFAASVEIYGAEELRGCDGGRTSRAGCDPAGASAGPRGTRECGVEAVDEGGNIAAR